MTGSAKSNARILAEECLCRAVGYAVADEFAYAMNCHCSGCRRATGAAFKPFAGIARDRLSVTKGEGSLTIHGDGQTTTCIAGARSGFAAGGLYLLGRTRREKQDRPGPNRRGAGPTND